MFVIVLIVSTIIDIKDKIRASENTIIVSETGTIYTKPDLALATASVVTEKKTVAEAKTKAKELAGQLGVKLVRVSNFSESGLVPYFYSLEKTAAEQGMGGGTPQIETGENKIEVTVSITYEIR